MGGGDAIVMKRVARSGRKPVPRFREAL